MTISRFRKPVVVASEDASTAEVAQEMRRQRVGCVVVARGNRPVGVVTDRDLAIRVVGEGLDPATTKVRDVVTYDPFVIEEAASLETAAARMREHGVRRLPIVDANGAVIGIVTADDLAVMLGRELANVCAAIDESADTTESR